MFFLEHKEALELSSAESYMFSAFLFKILLSLQRKETNLFCYASMF